MAVPVDYFQPESFQQANPMLSGVSAAQQIFSQGAQNAFLPQNLQAQLQSAQLKNAMMQTQNQYLPQQLQSKIGLMQAQIPLAQAQTQETQARIPLENAQTWQIQNFPVQGDISGQLSYLNYLGKTQGPNSPNYQLGQNLLNAQIEMLKNRALFYGANVGLKNLPTAVKNQAIADGMPIGFGAGGLPNSIMAASPGANMPQNGNNPANASSAYGNLNTPAVQQTAQNAALKETTTNQIANQRQYSQILGNLMNQAQPLIPSVAKYAGAQGQAQLVADRVAASSGSVNPDYQNYLTFTRAYAPNIANEMRRTLGGQATDSERKVMDSLTNPAYWDSNPQIAMQQFSSLQNMYKTAVNPALAQSLSQVQNNLQSDSKTPATNPGISAPITTTLNGKTYKKINGQWYQQ